MNYDGNMDYTDSGYISLFEYRPNNVCCRDGRNFQQSAWTALNELLTPIVHFIFIPPGINEVNIDEYNVHNIPASNGPPCLYNTDQCSPPARVTEDGRVIEYVNRYINEYLYTGGWLPGTAHYPVPSNSAFLHLLRLRMPVAEILAICQTCWPCPGGDDYTDKDPRNGDGGGSCGGTGTGGGSTIAAF